MTTDLHLKLQYTEIVRSVKDGRPVIAMRHRVKDLTGARRTNEWVYMDPEDGRDLAAKIVLVLNELPDGSGQA